MSEYREFKWKIGAYSAETMPLDRLLEYLSEFSAMLGVSDGLHLVRVESSSTGPVFKVDPEAALIVEQRALAVRTGTASVESQRRYRKINRMLRDDNTDATLVEGSAEIIPFPGIKEGPPRVVAGIHQPGSLDGFLISIGGRRESVPLQIETPEKVIAHIYAKRPLAKELSQHLFEHVRLLGVGRWSRTEDGEWQLDHFNANAFEMLEGEALPQVMAQLRAVNARWPADPLAALHELRHGDDEPE